MGIDPIGLGRGKERRPLFHLGGGARDTNGCYGGVGTRGVLMECGWAIKIDGNGEH